MRMIRLAIADDDPFFRAQLQEFVDRYAAETGLKFSTEVYCDGDGLLREYQPGYDLVLLDIQLPNVNGMTAAKAIRAVDETVSIVFITNMAQYAIEGYSVNALDYVLKPVSYYAFSQCLNRAVLRQKQRESVNLFIYDQHGGSRISSASLLFVEVHGHQLIYHTKDGDITAAGSMKDVEEALEGLPFFRCNKCDLVNLSYVESVRDGDAKVGPFTVQLSRAKKKPFMETLNRYLNEVRA